MSSSDRTMLFALGGVALLAYVYTQQQRRGGAAIAPRPLGLGGGGPAPPSIDGARYQPGGDLFVGPINNDPSIAGAGAPPDPADYLPGGRYFAGPIEPAADDTHDTTIPLDEIFY